MTPWTTPCYLLNKLGNDSRTNVRLTLPIINYVTTRSYWTTSSLYFARKSVSMRSCECGASLEKAASSEMCALSHYWARSRWFFEQKRDCSKSSSLPTRAWINTCLFDTCEQGWARGYQVAVHILRRNNKRTLNPTPRLFINLGEQKNA